MNRSFWEAITRREHNIRSGEPQLHLSQETVDEYCFHRLPQAQAAAVKEHVTVCVPCSQKLQQDRKYNRLLRRALERGTGSIVLSGAASQKQLGFSPDQLRAAHAKLPVSQAVLGRCLATLSDPSASLETLEAIVVQDPVIAAHLVRAASAALNSRREIRSLQNALAQLGLDRVRFHILGASLKGTFAHPHLRELWDHSISVASLARDLAQRSKVANPETACLAGLVHDIGGLLFAALGSKYTHSFAELKQSGLAPVEAERRLCGSDHADVGANLLLSWAFPADLVESVRYHHAPSLSDSALTSLLYIAEIFADREEAECHAVEHAIALQRLSVSPASLRDLGAEIDPDLRTLQVAA